MNCPPKDFVVEGVLLKNFVNLPVKEKELVLSWRNDQRVRSLMINQDVIAFKDHLEFIETLKTSLDKSYWAAEVKGKLVGSVYLYGMREDVCYWGYYVDPQFIGRSYGLILEYVVLQLVFTVLNFKRLRCETLSVNKSVLGLHQSVGFKVLFEKKGLVEMEISSTDWVARRDALNFFMRKVTEDRE